jgi:hypothetical protein
VATSQVLVSGASRHKLCMGVRLAVAAALHSLLFLLMFYSTVQPPDLSDESRREHQQTTLGMCEAAVTCRQLICLT